MIPLIGSGAGKRNRSAGSRSGPVGNSTCTLDDRADDASDESATELLSTAGPRHGSSESAVRQASPSDLHKTADLGLLDGANAYNAYERSTLDDGRTCRETVFSRKLTGDAGYELLSYSKPHQDVNRSPSVSAVNELYEEMGFDEVSPRTDSTVLFEVFTLAKTATPLIITYFLEYSLQLVSVIMLGHVGTLELAGSSIGSMTANMTGIAIIEGAVTALDTLSSQAWGAGHYDQLGLNLQRCLILLFLLHIPIASIWIFNAEYILRVWLYQDPQVAKLASTYLRYFFWGLPGYSLFECLKRYLQAQGRFCAGAVVLVCAAPLNILLHYMLIFWLHMGFIGAPVAISITNWFMCLSLVAYILFIGGREGWNGFSWNAFRGWGPLCKFSAAGVLEVCTEWFAFEIIGLSASRLGTDSLAANSVLSTISATTYRIPFAISVACSTRVGTLLGADLPNLGRGAAYVALGAAIFVGLFNALILLIFGNQLALIFIDKANVVALIAHTLPSCAFFQLFDALAVTAGGICRGQGMQHISGYTNLVAYWFIGLPVSLTLAYKAHWELYGLWSGMILALGITSAYLCFNTIYMSDWKAISRAAVLRVQSDA